MTPLASLHLPPQISSGYVRIELGGKTAGYLRTNVYDQVIGDEEAFSVAMKDAGAEEEAHSKPGRRVVRLRGQAALSALYNDLSLRDYGALHRRAR